jgi:hypothetical protein
MSPLPLSPRRRGVSLPSAPIFPVRTSSLGALDNIATPVLVSEGMFPHPPSPCHLTDLITLADFKLTSWCRHH